MVVDAFRLLHLSDLHLMDGETIPGVHPSNRLAEFLAEIVERGLRIDACVITGDLAHNGSSPAYRRLANVLNSCPWPTRVVPGNHDEIEVGREILGDNYWPEADTWRWQLREKLSLVGTSSVIPGFHHGELSDDSLAELTRVISNLPHDESWLLACHHPPQDVGHWWMDGQGLLRGREQILEIVDSKRALAVVCGHLHMTVIVRRPSGAQILVAPSVAHEVVFDDRHEKPLRFRARSPRALLHSIHGQQMTTVEITGGGSSHLVEGRPWPDEVMRTNLRKPAPR